MRYRKLSASGDMVFGHGGADFYRDNPEAVAQAIGTRLKLFKGEWFLDTTEGMDWRTKVLGNNTELTRDLVIRERILRTQGVAAISVYGSTYEGTTRGFAVTAIVDTAYGQTSIREVV